LLLIWLWQNVHAEKLLAKIKENDNVRELSTNPLMLTMLCLTIRDYGFPKQSYDLYEDAVELFLRRWDSSRLIERSEVLDLSSRRKSNLLSKLAFSGFSNPAIKDVWRKNEIEQEIANFIKNISSFSPEDLQDLSSEILRSIQANHGLITIRAKDEYSFSHLTFQEYFAAQYILESQEVSVLENSIQKYLVTPHWREVFLMIASRISNADHFLKMLFYHVNELAAKPAIQETLKWLNRKTTDSRVGSSSWRAGYLAIDLELDLYLSRTINIQKQ
jgi:predicted NACHT family NTPase